MKHLIRRDMFQKSAVAVVKDIYIGKQPVNMNYSFDSLKAIVDSQKVSGKYEWYVFFNKNRDKLKMFNTGNRGCVIRYCRLTKDVFPKLSRRSVTNEEFSAFLKPNIPALITNLKR